MDEIAENDVARAPRRHSGCLMGCLGAVLFVILAVGGLVGVAAWTLYHDIHGDGRLTAILDTVRGDERATAVIGGGFTVMEIERHSFPMKAGQALAYHLILVGPNGESALDARLEPSREGLKIVAIILTGPDGQTLWLKGGTANPWMRSI
jgi:hypothetical protein